MDKQTDDIKKAMDQIINDLKEEKFEDLYLNDTEYQYLYDVNAVNETLMFDLHKINVNLLFDELFDLLRFIKPLEEIM